MMHSDILTYNATQSPIDLAICTILADKIDSLLVEAESKIWHGHPVWFLDSNPVLGYSKQKRGIVLLFWSGQSFDEENLKPEGSFKGAEIYYNNPEEINIVDLERWISKSRDIQWDYKNIVKRRGKLERLK